MNNVRVRLGVFVCLSFAVLFAFSFLVIPLGFAEDADQAPAQPPSQGDAVSPPPTPPPPPSEAVTPPAAPSAQQPAAPPAPAEQPPAAPAEETGHRPVKMKPIVVTGSNIATLEEESVAPVLKIDREEIDRSGASTVTEVLRKIPANTGNSFGDNQSAGSFSPGATAVSLRGLGAQSTLVLINGRRVAPYPFAQNFGVQSLFVDINSIPLAAVERVEVLKDSGSAIYGSDAIAGVVNVILKKDYTGTEIGGEWGNTTKNDLFDQTYYLLSGLVSENANIMFIMDYNRRNDQFLRDRKVSSHGFTSSASPDGIVFDPDPNSPTAGFPFFVPPHPGTGMIRSNDLSATPFNSNFFNTNPNITDYPATERYGGYTVVNYNLTEKLTLFVEAGYRKIKTHYEINPTPIFGDQDGFTIGPDNPYNPYPGFATPFRWRPLEAGRRIDDIDTDVIRVLPGLRLQIGETWTVESAFLYNENKSVDSGRNFLSSAALQSALNDTNPATALNPVGGFDFHNNPATIESLKVRTSRTGKFDYWSYDVKGNGTVFDLPAGPLGLAVGGETRYEKLSDIPDSFSQVPGAIVSQGGNQASGGKRDSDALYAELAIPIFSKQNAIDMFQSLEIQAAGRFEYYSDFGTTTKPKVGIKWQPVQPLLLRASYSQGFRAPTLAELFQAQSIGFVSGLVDTPRCQPPAGNNPSGLPANDPNCTGDVQFKVLTGGNPDLKPENSESFYVGSTYEPPFIKGFTLSVDISRIVVKDVVSANSEQFIINNPNLFPPGTVRRGPPQFPGDIGQILGIDQRVINLAERRVDTLDFDAAYVRDTDIGKFTFDVNGTYLFSWFEKGETTAQFAGTSALPRFKGDGSIFWTYKKLTCGPTVNYISSYIDLDGVHRVNEWWSVDLQATYEFPHETTVTVGVLNVTNTSAPRSTLDEGYDNQVHDNRGQFVYGRITKKF